MFFHKYNFNDEDYDGLNEYQIYYYDVGYGGDWEELILVEAKDEDGALKKAREFWDCNGAGKEGRLYKAVKLTKSVV